MQPDVYPHVVAYPHRDLGRRPMVTLVTFLGLFWPLYVRPDHVVARGNQLLKLAHVIGIDLPARFLFSGGAYLDPNSIHGLILCVPHRSKDQAVMAFLGSFVAWKSCGTGRPA